MSLVVELLQKSLKMKMHWNQTKIKMDGTALFKISPLEIINNGDWLRIFRVGMNCNSDRF